MQKLLLTETEVGEITNLSRSTLRKLWAAGKLVPLKVGRSVRYPTDDVRSFVARLQEEAQVGQGRGVGGV